MQGTIRYIDGPGRSSKNISLKRLLISRVQPRVWTRLRAHFPATILRPKFKICEPPTYNFASSDGIFA